MKLILPAILLLCFQANAQQQFTVYFDFNQAVTNREVSQWMVANTNARIQKIYGYTDKSGSESYNQELSERRAGYIYERLKGAGIILDDVEQKGFGESQSTKNRNADDRKVVVYYTSPQISEPMVLRTDFGNKMITANRGDKVVLRGVHFRGGTAYILKESGSVLNELYLIMRDNPKLKIDIQGHICCEPDDIDNLSEKRAVEIFLYLKNNGIKEDRMAVKGFGSTRPVYKLPEKNQNEMQANRRVEIEIVEK